MLFFLNLLAYLLVLVVNGLAVYLPLNNHTTQEISNRLTVLFTPAGYVFSIWGAIYLLLAFWVFRMLLRKYRHSTLYREMSPLFIISCLLNSAWIFAWHYEFFILSVLVMLCLLVVLSMLYRKIRVIGDTFLGRLPFSVYLGWISVAFAANISYTLVDLGWTSPGITDIVWTFILLIVGTLTAIIFRYRNQDWIYSLVFVWTFIGIGVKDLQLSPIIAYASFILALILLVASLVRINTAFTD